MENIERIYNGEELLSIIIRDNYHATGITFITPDDYPHQLGYMNREKDYVIAPHVHNRVPRTVDFTQETLVVKSGVVRVDFYTQEQKYLVSAKQILRCLLSITLVWKSKKKLLFQIM